MRAQMGEAVARVYPCFLCLPRVTRIAGVRGVPVGGGLGEGRLMPLEHSFPTGTPIYAPTDCSLGFPANNCRNTYCKIPPLA
jgi:hypothetical protein